MNKSLILACTILAHAVTTADVKAPQKISPIKLREPVLAFVDGTNLIDVASMVHFARQIYQMETTGRITIIDPVTHTHSERVLMFRGCPCSIVHVAQVQQQAPQDPAVQAALQQAHKAALDIFVEISRPYLAEVTNSKEYMMRLITVWSEMRSRPDTDLLNWGSCVDEEREFYQHMNNPQRFCQFLEDLRCFLVDMMYTCEKSWKLYDEMRRGVNHNQPA